MDAVGNMNVLSVTAASCQERTPFANMPPVEGNIYEAIQDQEGKREKVRKSFYKKIIIKIIYTLYIKAHFPSRVSEREMEFRERKYNGKKN